LVDRGGQDAGEVTSRGSSSVFAGYRFLQELIAVAVRWYLRYSLSVQHKCSSIRHKEPREGYSGFGRTAKVELLLLDNLCETSAAPDPPAFAASGAC
jgi:hypothetical protein